MTTIDVRELRARLDEVLGRVLAGDEVLLMDGTVPRARLVPVPAEKQPERIMGMHPGNIICIAPDFDAELPDEFWLGEQ
ncbi:MAG: hypothetical protein J2P46_13915 [Zavarzinella sp.]|nr:hypothetical protein [Zavarzinella sp.]